MNPLCQKFVLTNNMSSEIVLKMNIVLFLPPMFINKHSFKVLSEKVCVRGQVKLEISKKERKKTKLIYINLNMIALLLQKVLLLG